MNKPLHTLVIYLTIEELNSLISQGVETAIKPYLEIIKEQAPENRFRPVSILPELTGLSLSAWYSKNSRREVPFLVKRGGRLFVDMVLYTEYMNKGLVKTK